MKRNYETDVIVLGCGGEGACAAIVAKDKGGAVEFWLLDSGFQNSIFELSRHVPPGAWHHQI